MDDEVECASCERATPTDWLNDDWVCNECVEDDRSHAQLCSDYRQSVL